MAVFAGVAALAMPASAQNRQPAASGASPMLLYDSGMAIAESKRLLERLSDMPGSRSPGHVTKPSRQQ